MSSSKVSKSAYFALCILYKTERIPCTAILSVVFVFSILNLAVFQSCLFLVQVEAIEEQENDKIANEDAENVCKIIGDHPKQIRKISCNKITFNFW